MTLGILAVTVGWAGRAVTPDERPLRVPPFYADDRVTVHHGDCLDVLRTLPDCSVDSVVTDPPAAIAFMNAAWDDDKGGRDAWVAWLASVLAECRRILKPGGHALVWALPRTSGWTHRAIEDAGLDVRDCITHLFGSGFPKSLDVGKAIDKAAGASRMVVGRNEQWVRRVGQGLGQGHGSSDTYTDATFGSVGPNGGVITAPATEDAARWDGFGTALKPSSEMWYLARRPLTGTVAANVLTHGTGALNIAAARVASAEPIASHNGTSNPRTAMGNGWHEAYQPGDAGKITQTAGRWPSNVVLSHGACTDDGCEPSCAVAELDAQSGTLKSGALDRSRITAANKTYGAAPAERVGTYEPNEGGASRFFHVFRYQAKAPTRERPKVDGVAHPTCKPLALMRWMTRLITPPGGVILDPFAGSGTTAEAAILEGFRCITIEREAEYLPLILARIQRQEPAEAPRPVAQQMSLLDDGSAA